MRILSHKHASSISEFYSFSLAHQCPAGWQMIDNGRYCMSNFMNSADMWVAIGVCWTYQARVCLMNGMISFGMGLLVFEKISTLF